MTTKYIIDDTNYHSISDYDDPNICNVIFTKQNDIEHNINQQNQIKKFYDENINLLKLFIKMFTFIVCMYLYFLIFLNNYD